MENYIVQEIQSSIVVNSPRRPKPELIETEECSGDLYVLKVAVNIGGLDYFIYLDLLDDGQRYFKNPFGQDSIDKDDNTPLYNKILMALRIKGLSEHKAALSAPLIFDYIANEAFQEFLRISGRTTKVMEHFVSNKGEQSDLFS